MGDLLLESAGNGCTWGYRVYTLHRQLLVVSRTMQYMQCAKGHLNGVKLTPPLISKGFLFIVEFLEKDMRHHITESLVKIYKTRDNPLFVDDFPVKTSDVFRISHCHI